MEPRDFSFTNCQDFGWGFLITVREALVHVILHRPVREPVIKLRINFLTELHHPNTCAHIRRAETRRHRIRPRHIALKCVPDLYFGLGRLAVVHAACTRECLGGFMHVLSILAH